MLILSLTEVGRLSRPRHVRKGAQPVPRAVYQSGCRDKRNCPRWVSFLRYCINARHVVLLSSVIGLLEN